MLTAAVGILLYQDKGEAITHLLRPRCIAEVGDCLE